MLKPLLRPRTANFAAIENNRLIMKTGEIDVLPETLIKSLTRTNRNLYIYTYDENYLDYFFNEDFGDIKIKKISRFNDIIAVKLSKNRNTLHIINAKFLIPARPPSLFAALKWLYDDLGKGLGCAYTAASYAMNYWRFKHLKYPLTGLSFMQEDFIRRSYAGGRAEIIEKKLEKGYEYDVNSIYADVMLNKMPTGSPIGVLGKNRNKSRIGFFKCRVKQDNYIPALWQKVEGSLCFPAREIEGVFSTAEIDKAIEMEAKIEIDYGYEFESSEYLFTDFVKEFYEIKEFGEDWKAKFAKKILVSFYGKFAQKRNYKVLEKTSPNDLLKNIDNNVEIIDEEKGIIAKNRRSYAKSSFVLPHISSYITSLARLKLYDKIQEIIGKGGRVAYYHTDSIFCDIPFEEKDVGTALGQWKLVGEVENAEFIAINTYRAEINGKEILKTGGVNGNDNIKDLYLKGERVLIKKKGYNIKELKDHSIKLKTNNLYKRNFDGDVSMPASVGEILNKMQIVKKIACSY